MATSSPSPTPPMDGDMMQFVAQQQAASAGATTQLGSVVEGLLGIRGSLTTIPLQGYLPKWVDAFPQLRESIKARTFDPYLATGNSKDWRVFLGSGSRESLAPAPGDPSHGAIPGRSGVTPADKTVSIEQAKNEVMLWDADKVAESIKKFQDAGFKSVNDFNSLASAYGSLVERAGAAYSLSSGQKKLTPWDVLDMDKSALSKAGVSPGGGGGSLAGTRTQVQKTVSEISQGDAWAALRSTVSQMLGHDPDDQEVRDFAYRMNSLAAKNPSISTSTITSDEAGNTASSTHSKPGFTGNDVAKGAYDEAQADPDYAEYQSATTYFNAALSALGEIGG